MTPTIIEEDSRGASKKFVSLVIVFGDNIVKVAEHENRRTVLQLVTMLVDTFFDLKILL